MRVAAGSIAGPDLWSRSAELTAGLGPECNISEIIAMSESRLHLPPEVPPEEATLLLSLKLFEAGRLSLGKAAELAGYSKRTFMEILAKHGTPVYNYTEEDLEEEFDDVEDDEDDERSV